LSQTVSLKKTTNKWTMQHVPLRRKNAIRLIFVTTALLYSTQYFWIL